MGSCFLDDGEAPLDSATPESKKRKTPKKKPQRDEWLQMIPGRMSFSGSTGVASLFTKQGKKGINQDAMIVWENYCSREDTIFCGVFDGHGPYGHMVARRVRDSFPLKLSAQWDLHMGGKASLSDTSGSALENMNSRETAHLSVDTGSRKSIDWEDEDKHPGLLLTLKEPFLKAFRVMDKELKLHPKIDCFCSGTTAVVLVKQGHDLVVGNIGDSRAVLGTRDKDDSLVAVQLTVDLKPNIPQEAERIRQCKGRVFALQNEPEVLRVWLPNNNSPGLAMSRAFGDFCLKDFGLISVPEISYHCLTDKDEFVVLATDGIWDVLTNEEVVDIVASAPRAVAARHLVEHAVQAWRSKYPFAKVDDCAVVCLFLHSDGSSAVSTSEEQAASMSKPVDFSSDKGDGSRQDTLDHSW